MNTGEDNITLYPDTPIARCTSSYEAKYGSSHEVAMVHTVHTEQQETLAEEKQTPVKFPCIFKRCTRKALYF